MEWRTDFENAPKDGTQILAWGPYNQSVCVAMWTRTKSCGEGWHAAYEGDVVIEAQGDFGTDHKACDPLTHWAILPEPPQ